MKYASGGGFSTRRYGKRGTREEAQVYYRKFYSRRLSTSSFIILRRVIRKTGGGRSRLKDHLW